jgi:hypothetical protein
MTGSIREKNFEIGTGRVAFEASSGKPREKP